MEESRNYELAFHLNPDLDEAKVAELKQALEKDITASGGVITFAKEPEKIRLSYAINHKTNSYFGYFQFALSEGENLEHLNAQLKLMPDVIRYLIIKTASEAEKNKNMARQFKLRERLERKAAAAPKAPPKGEDKEIDKKLEDIIGNL